MISKAALAGYILEELLAGLMQSAGYRLLTHESQDPDELKHNNSGDLQVKGRGGFHQVDVLGEFTIVPAFSHPLRLFVEAKARAGPAGLPSVRNAVGTISDVNQAWMIDYSTNRARRHYRYALFSTSGFTAPAQAYAIAHQISLVDLSGPEWEALRYAVDEAADELLAAVPSGVTKFPIRLLRRVLRRALGTAPDMVPHVEPSLQTAVAGLGGIAHGLVERLGWGIDGALLAFPAGHQMLLVRPDDIGRFLHHAQQFPEHHVSLSLERERQGDTAARTWVVRPIDSRDQYALRMTLPAAVEEKALVESDRRAQAMAAKGELGGRLDIFWDPHRRHLRLPGPRLFRLIFATADIRRAREGA